MGWVSLFLFELALYISAKFWNQLSTSFRYMFVISKLHSLYLTTVVLSRVAVASCFMALI